MFPIAHLYLLTRIIPDPQPMHLLGCVWPDILFDGPLTHHQTHREGLRLLTYVREHDPEIEPFVVGALTHGAEPHGFDWYSDEHYDEGAPKGFAFERSRPFIAEIIAASNIDPAIGLWKAHNFVEMTFEIWLSRIAPDLGPTFRSLCNDTNLIARIVPTVAACYGCDPIPLQRNIQMFPSYVALDQPDAATLAQVYSLQLEGKHGVTGADVPAMATILERISVAIQDERETFLATAIERVGAMIHAVVG